MLPFGLRNRFVSEERVGLITRRQYRFELGISQLGTVCGRFVRIRWFSRFEPAVHIAVDFTQDSLFLLRAVGGLDIEQSQTQKAQTQYCEYRQTDFLAFFQQELLPVESLESHVESPPVEGISPVRVPC